MVNFKSVTLGIAILLMILSLLVTLHAQTVGTNANIPCTRQVGGKYRPTRIRTDAGIAVYRNGLRQRLDTDFSYSAGLITPITTWNVSDVVIADWIR